MVHNLGYPEGWQTLGGRDLLPQARAEPEFCPRSHSCLCSPVGLGEAVSSWHSCSGEGIVW